MMLDATSLTRKLLSYNTVKPPGNKRDCAYYLGKLLEEAGCEVRYEQARLCVAGLRQSTDDHSWSRRA